MSIFKQLLSGILAFLQRKNVDDDGAESEHDKDEDGSFFDFFDGDSDGGSDGGD